MSDNEPDGDGSLERLGQRLDAVRSRRKRGERTPEEAANREGMAVGLRIAVELAAAIVVGTAIGFGLDRWLGTRPWLMIVFILIGAAAGFLQVYRTAQELDRRQKERRAEAAKQQRPR